MATAVVFTEVVSVDLIADDDAEVENCSIEARKSSTVVKATGGFGSRLGRVALAIKVVVLLITVYNIMKTVLKPNS